MKGVRIRMRKLIIATGASRKEQKWKNKQVEWEQLKKKLSITTRIN